MAAKKTKTSRKTCILLFSHIILSQKRLDIDGTDDISPFIVAMKPPVPVRTMTVMEATSLPMSITGTFFLDLYD